MNSNLTVSLSLAALFLVSTSASFAGELPAPIPVDQFDASAPVPSLDSLPVKTDENGNELIDLTVDQVERDMQEMQKDSLFDDEQNDARISKINPATAVGKVLIRVHKSSNPSKKPEYLEVFKIKSSDLSSLEPQMLFDRGTSHKALVSTAGTYSGKVYSTPTGIFTLDTMETMHYSSLYNNAPMPWSQFFNGGIALHGATPDEFKLLGRKASHGCVRLHPDNAKILFAFDKAQGKSKVVVQVLAE